ncbi:MAG: glycosyltransferase [Flavobacteriales bacterium]|nr:glycosyltransferase [Flavobacteriales bacterium]MCB9196209.1 glycosyltransferase [Flavobacteriales bacterium]
MELSVIIVNYNVKHFLEQCLNSVALAMKGLDVEVFVVDNISIDGSVEMVREKFEWVNLIANQENVGFSRANNQAIRISKGKYILLLNPDTVVEEDTFRKVIGFMNDHPKCGGLGVKMIDGKGKFLPESKRGLPTPSVAFYKISGLARIFPKSKKFGQYHLGFLPMEETNKIEILSGAFMMMRKSVLDEVGLLDEDFFMYGEDIDLSYRIILGGYENYYFPETSIIHYKGESTKKSSINYVFVFYNAMIIFARKHFSEKNARLFSFFINIAIYIRAGMAIISRFVRRMTLPFLDLLVVFGGFWITSFYYQKFKQTLEEGFGFETDVLLFELPVFAFIVILAIYLFGGYDKPIRLLSSSKGVVLGTLIILAVYGLLPKDFQFSRFVILIGSFLSGFLVALNRGVLSWLKIEGYSLEDASKKRFLIIGDEEERDRIEPLLKQTTTITFLGNFQPEGLGENSQRDNAGALQKVSDYIYINKINEVIFSAKNLSMQKIIETMSSLRISRDVDYKIAQPDSMYLIGSNSIHTSGDLYILDLNSINSVSNRRAKRVFDFISSLLLMLVFPVVLIFNAFRLSVLKEMILVFIGRKTWVGYFPMSLEEIGKVPKIKQGVIPCEEGVNFDSRTILKMNQIYAKDYSWTKDFSILSKSLGKLSRSC